MPTYHESAAIFEEENRTTTWSYGHFQKLIETYCHQKSDLILVEVGVARGGHLRHLLDNFYPSIKKLYGIDPHVTNYDPGQDAFSGRSQEVFDHMHLWVKKTCADPKFELLRLPSTQGAKRFSEESIDAIYIDGNHSYEAVYDDITAWISKIKPGGLLAGDDFAQRSGVSKAVKELIPNYNSAPNDTWYWIKK